MATETIVNGIDSAQLKRAMSELRQHPELAKFRFRAENNWVDGAHCQTSIQNFDGMGQALTRPSAFILHADEPPELLGTDKGPNATEALLYALSSCLNTTFMFQAAARGIHVDELKIEIEGELDLRGFLGLAEGVRNGYEHIRVTFHVNADATDGQIAELVEAAQKRSPVFDIVTHATPVSAEWQIG